MPCMVCHAWHYHGNHKRYTVYRDNIDIQLYSVYYYKEK